MPEEPTPTPMPENQIVPSQNPPQSDRANNTKTPHTELTANVEKISRIIAPYFTVLVGLYLYKSNFWIGFLFIGLGMLALLNISMADIGKAIASIKAFFGLTNE